MEKWKQLCAGDEEATIRFLKKRRPASIAALIILIALGAGCYGATLGIWRSPDQALYAGLKFPLIIFCTVAINALLNGMVAHIIGASIPFRESALAVLLSFGITALILASLAPVLFFFVLNAPPLDSPEKVSGHSTVLLLHVIAIGSAGAAGNLRLYGLLRALTNQLVAKRIVTFWLAANLFVGSQLSWICRPFIGSPSLPVEFFRADALHGSFYEAVWKALHTII